MVFFDETPWFTGETNDTIRVITGKFRGFVSVTDSCSMAVVDVGKIRKMIPIDAVIVIDVLEPEKLKEIQSKDDVMVG